jgi:hypothetical protein
MPAKRLLRVLILAQLPLFLGTGLAAYLSVASLPDSLRYLVSNKDQLVPGASAFEVGGAVAFLVANVCLFVFWNGAPALYLAITVALHLASFYLGPFVSTGWSDLFETSLTMLSGIILGLIYFSPAQELFKRREAVNQSSVPQAAVPQFAVVETPVEVPLSGALPLFCGACGARGQGGKFCPECGKPLLAKNPCPRCGVEVEPGKKFCRECGARMP